MANVAPAARPDRSDRSQLANTAKAARRRSAPIRRRPSPTAVISTARSSRRAPTPASQLRCPSRRPHRRKRMVALARRISCTPVRHHEDGRLDENPHVMRTRGETSEQSGRGKCLSLSDRRETYIPFYEPRTRAEAAPLLHQCLPELFAQKPLHARPPAPHHALGPISATRQTPNPAGHSARPRTGMGVARPLCVIHVPHRRDAVQENSRLDSLRPKLSEKIMQGALYRSNIAGEPNARPNRGSRVGSLCQFSRGRRLNYCIWQCRRLHRRAAASLAAPIFRNTCARCTSLRVQMTVPW